MHAYALDAHPAIAATAAMAESEKKEKAEPIMIPSQEAAAAAITIDGTRPLPKTNVLKIKMKPRSRYRKKRTLSKQNTKINRNIISWSPKFGKEEKLIAIQAAKEVAAEAVRDACRKREVPPNNGSEGFATKLKRPSERSVRSPTTPGVQMTTRDDSPLSPTSPYTPKESETGYFKRSPRGSAVSFVRLPIPGHDEGEGGRSGAAVVASTSPIEQGRLRYINPRSPIHPLRDLSPTASFHSFHGMSPDGENAPSWTEKEVKKEPEASSRSGKRKEAPIAQTKRQRPPILLLLKDRQVCCQ